MKAPARWGFLLPKNICIKGCIVGLIELYWCYRGGSEEITEGACDLMLACDVHTNMVKIIFVYLYQTA